jgi:hypothetical protein
LGEISTRLDNELERGKKGKRKRRGHESRGVLKKGRKAWDGMRGMAWQ